MYFFFQFIVWKIKKEKNGFKKTKTSDLAKQRKRLPHFGGPFRTKDLLQLEKNENISKEIKIYIYVWQCWIATSLVAI